MRLAQLTVRNFRNIAALDVELPATGVVLLGANGHGKTNVLEAVYYLVLFRSLRAAKDRELVRFGEAGFFVAGHAGRRVTAGYEIAGRRKKVTIDGVEMRRLADAVGTITAVAFSPTDRGIVDGGPAARRRYLDVLLALSTPDYLAHLTHMRGALRQRNAALRQGDARTARAFDEPLARAGRCVIAARAAWAGRWAARFANLCAALGERGTGALRYAPRHAIGEGSDGLERALGEALDRDLRRGMTTVGPHRDDLRLTLDDRDLRAYGSAGQQRTAAIALRLLEAETLTAARGTPPIALYDDVFAELDAGRQERLLALIRETLPGQAVVTAPRASEVPEALLDRPRWRVEGGRVEG